MALKLLSTTPSIVPMHILIKEFTMKTKSKLDKFTPLLLGTCMLTLVAACGSSDDDDSGTPPQQEQNRQEGAFRAELAPLNTNAAPLAVAGTADFLIEADSFEAKVMVTGAPNSTHIQRVHIGTSCPDQTSDANGDGYVDVVEASAIAGGALIPLDSDLVSQSAGGTYPRGAAYNYSETTSLQAMLADLRLPDTDPADSMVKLGADEELNLEGKVLIVHGVPDSVTLPETVVGVDSLTANQTLPIACGVITRVQDETTTGSTAGGTTGGATGGTTGETTGGATGGTTGETTGGTTGETTGGATGGTTGTTTGGTTTGI